MLNFVEHVGATKPSGGDSAASISFTFPATLPAGAVLVVSVISGSAGAKHTPGAGEQQTHQDTDDHTLADDAGTPWEKAVEHTVDKAPSRPGCTLSVWWVQLGAALPAGTILTASFPGSLISRILSVDRYALEGTGASAVLVAAAITGGGNIAEDYEVSLGPIASGDYRWVGRGAAADQNSVDGSGFSFVPDVPAGWVEERTPLWNGGNNFAGMMEWAQGREFNGDAQTWMVGTATRSAWVMALLAFEEGAPPAPPPDYPEGWREFTEDFATPEHMVEDTSLTHRPDAIVLDPRVASCVGPAAISNLSQGRESRRWQVRIVPGTTSVEARVSTFGNAGWGDWVPLFTYTGAEAREITVAFNWDGSMAVALERPTGSGGAPEVWLTIGTSGGFSALSNLGAGRNPRAVLGNFDGEGTRCSVGDPLVQLFYLKPGAGLVRREGPGFGAEATTPVGYSEDRYLHKAVLTGGRRVAVAYHDHDEVTGQHSHAWAVSVPFPRRLRRPTFDISDPFAGLNFCWLRGQMYRNPQDTVVESTLAAIVYSHVTGVKLQFQTSATIPSGYQPPGEGGIWSAIQESPVLTGTTQWTFTFPVSHGAGTSSVRALRCRAVLGEDSSCVSGWAYWVAVPEWPFADIIYEDVNCFRDAVICTPRIEGLLFEVAGFDAGCHPCDAEPVCEAACGPGFDGYFFGGVENIGGYTRNWGVRLRAAETGTRTWWDDWLGPEDDPLEPRFVGGLVSRPFTSWTSGAGGVFETSGDQWPLQWPPGGY